MGDIISRKYVVGQLQDWQFANASHENAEAYNLIGVFIKMIEQLLENFAEYHMRGADVSKVKEVLVEFAKCEADIKALIAGVKRNEQADR